MTKSTKSQDETQEHTFGSALLIPEHPIAFSPTLACVIGDRQAIAIQQIHYWLDINRKAKKLDTHFRDGRWWTYNTYAEWEGSFPFWSRRTIRRMINELEEKGLLLSEQFGARKGDQTKWYTVDYDLLDFYLEQREKAETLVNTEVAKLDSHLAKLDSHLAKLDSHLAKLDSQEDKVDNSLQRSLHRLHPENSSETSNIDSVSDENADNGESNLENGLANDEKTGGNNGSVSGKNQIQDKGRRETHETQNETVAHPVKRWNLDVPIALDAQGYIKFPPMKNVDPTIKPRFTQVLTRVYRETQFHVVEEWIDSDRISIDEDEDGEIVISDINGDWTEEEAFGQKGCLPLRLLRDIAATDEHSGFSAEEYNQFIVDRFNYHWDRL
jgi:hypothetical protein